MSRKMSWKINRLGSTSWIDLSNFEVPKGVHEVGNTKKLEAIKIELSNPTVTNLDTRFLENFCWRDREAEQFFRV